MKKVISALLSAALMVTLISGAITVTATEGDSPLGASACCAGHKLGTFSGVTACVNENGDLHVCENNFPDENFKNYITAELSGTCLLYTSVYCAPIVHLRAIIFTKLWCVDNGMTIQLLMNYLGAGPGETKRLGVWNAGDGIAILSPVFIFSDISYR